MSWHIREAVRKLAAGGIIAYPTETVYGLGCDPFNAIAVLHLIDLKKRNIEQGLILVASQFEQLEPLLCPLRAEVRRRVIRPARHPVTWVLPCLRAIPVWLRGKHDSLAIRVSNHPVTAALCDHWGGPLVSSSANLHGSPPATTPLAVRKAFNGQLDYILHGTHGSTNKPSQIRNGLTGELLRNNA
ncbi:MAG: Sua5/YciO/YrdC/YwlC family protein [Gammaproteobacteria bacterium]|jgi:L-threonylcarbamoyladenylate synthase|nr:Sua5/YciO/YrdC/YwlC family protein [Gammaproteobacteria bacterium]